jgi:hypothetical protein
LQIVVGCTEILLQESFVDRPILFENRFDVRPSASEFFSSRKTLLSSPVEIVSAVTLELAITLTLPARAFAEGKISTAATMRTNSRYFIADSVTPLLHRRKTSARRRYAGFTGQTAGRCPLVILRKEPGSGLVTILANWPRGVLTTGQSLTLAQAIRQRQTRGRP